MFKFTKEKIKLPLMSKLSPFLQKHILTNNRNYIIGLNLHEHPQNLTIGIIDLDGNQIVDSNFDCKGLMLRDDRYITTKRQMKLKEICLYLFNL